MIRWLLLPLLALAVGAALAVGLRDDPGYVLIQMAGYTLESSVAGLALITAVVVALAIVVWRLLHGGVMLPARVGGLLQERRLQKARHQLRLGLDRLAAGQWERAEIELLRRVADTDEPGVNYLYAAEAAHRLQAPERRDQYLELARQSDSGHQAAVLLRRAELWAEERRNLEALMALDELGALLPRHPPATRLRLELLEAEGRWQDLVTTAAEARGQLEDATLDAIAVRGHRALLSQARASGRLEALRSAWQAVPKALRHDPELLVHYAYLLHEVNADADGLRLLTAELKKAWNPQFALCFGQLNGGDVVSQLARVEDWIKRYGEKPELLLTAGRLCLRNRLWGRARSYFEACLQRHPSPELRLELGKLLIQQGDDDKLALEQFRQGLESSLAGGATTQELVPAERGTA